MGIDRRRGLDDGIHVGDGDQDLDPAIGQLLGDGELIEVLRGVVIDGTPKEIAQVADRAVLGAGRRGDAAELRRALAGKSGSRPRSSMAWRAMARRSVLFIRLWYAVSAATRSVAPHCGTTLRVVSSRESKEQLRARAVNGIDDSVHSAAYLRFLHLAGIPASPNPITRTVDVDPHSSWRLPN